MALRIRFGYGANTQSIYTDAHANCTRFSFEILQSKTDGIFSVRFFMLG